MLLTAIGNAEAGGGSSVLGKQKVDLYLMMNQKYFPAERIMFLRERLLQMDDDTFMRMSMVQLKDPTVILIVSLFVGTLGIDRFMLEEPAMGVLKLLTAGGCGVWAIVDLFLVMNKTRELNFSKIIALL